MTVKTLMTADELLRMPHDDMRYELIEGELIQMSPAMPEHGWHGAELVLSIGGYAKPRRLGVVFDSRVGYKFGSNPDTVLEPDVSFFRTERLPPRKDWKTFFTVPPDIAVEILSPSERRAHVNKKIGIYLGAGVRLLWLVDPRKRVVTVYAPGRDPIVLREFDMLDGEDVLPGFRLPLGDLFGGADGDHGANGAGGIA
ncbi:MAG TPA: Uma2 family endonuclease [Thermomicrobiales bacterium]|jgi:Uma2 family endonuclease